MLWKRLAGILLAALFTLTAQAENVVLEDFNWTDGFNPSAHGWTLVGSPSRSEVLSSFSGGDFLPLFGSTKFVRLRVSPDQNGESLVLSKSFQVFAGDTITIYDGYVRLEAFNSTVTDSFSITGRLFNGSGAQVGNDLVFRQGLSQDHNDGQWFSQSILIPSNGTLLVEIIMAHVSGIHTIGKHPSLVLGALHADRVAPVPLPSGGVLIASALASLFMMRKKYRTA